MEWRRPRRIRRGQSRTLLPSRVTRLSNTVSCWYCDFKTSAFNQLLFRFGRRYARFLRIWFSVGVVFSQVAMLGVFAILMWESTRVLHLYDSNSWLGRILSGALFGISPSGFGLGISVIDFGYACISTIISVSAHELGHALAASSEGIQMEYIALFLAVMFPGALVAFNYELLQELPTFNVLRIYCAGIWHNLVCCAVCGLALFLLPLILYPFYIHGESPMVVTVSSMSPLSGFLSPGDLIVSLDGVTIHNAQEWMEMAAHVHEQTLKITNLSYNSQEAIGKKGYCVPSSLLEASKEIQLMDNQYACPGEFAAFETISCFNSSLLDDGSFGNIHQQSREDIHCLVAKDVVKLNKCGDGWLNSASNNSTCLCSEDNFCLTPVLTRGIAWVEIVYASPYSPKCLQIGRNSDPSVWSSKAEGETCGGTFVFIGDLISMAYSVQLTAYRPRWSTAYGAYLPGVLEKTLMCTVRISLALALLNSLPVYFLDGESILETTLCYLTSLSPRMKGRILQFCLLMGTLISIVTLFKIFFFILLYA
ncbi:S2P endopeptidase [Bertholletia excelsa]